MENLYYSKHAQERFAERFPSLIENEDVLTSLKKCFEGATEERQSKNNTRYLVYLMEKYGDFDFDFYVNGRVLFICRQGCIITVMDRAAGNKNGISPAYRLHGTDKSRFKKEKVT